VYLGLAVSLLLHSGLLAWALVSINSARDFPTPVTDVVAVDFVTISDVNKMRQGSRQSKLKDAAPKENTKADPALKETKKPKEVTPPPAKSEPPPEETAKEEVKPAEQKLAAAVPPKSEPKAEPKAEPKPEPDKAALEKKLAELAKEPLPGPTPEELKKIEDDKLAAQKEAEQKAEAEKKAEAERKADAERKAEEERKAEAERKADAERKAEEQRKAEEDRKEKEKHRIAEEKRKAEEKKKAELKRLADKKKADEKKKREAEAKAKLDLDRLSALIDKSEPKSAPAGGHEPDVPTKAKGPVAGDRDGRDQTMSATEASFLAGLMRQAVSRCWNINAGLEGIDRIVVKVQVKLTRDGRLIGPPRVVNNSPSPLFRDAADSAVRALVQCEPYALPPDKYEGGWEYMELSFDPARMF
jgi:colicin import membrane protein